jgi:hypothetical protein
LKIPSELNILGIPVKVVFRQDGELSISASASHSAWYNKIWITNNPERSSQAQAQDLLHEIMEAINGANDLKLDHTVLSTIASSLFQVLSDNRLLFAEENDAATRQFGDQIEKHSK